VAAPVNFQGLSRGVACYSWAMSDEAKKPPQADSPNAPPDLHPGDFPLLSEEYVEKAAERREQEKLLQQPPATKREQ
jgi:hypothetical protein